MKPKFFLFIDFTYDLDPYSLLCCRCAYQGCTRAGCKCTGKQTVQSTDKHVSCLCLERFHAAMHIATDLAPVLECVINYCYNTITDCDHSLSTPHQILPGHMSFCTPTGTYRTPSTPKKSSSSCPPTQLQPCPGPSQPISRAQCFLPPLPCSRTSPYPANPLGPAPQPLPPSHTYRCNANPTTPLGPPPCPPPPQSSLLSLSNSSHGHSFCPGPQLPTPLLRLRAWPSLPYLLCTAYHH